MEIQLLREQDFRRWNDFVDATPGASFFHRAGWKAVLERGLNHRTFFLFAEAEGEIVGILPLGLVKSRLFGNSLTSLAFCAHCGVLATSQDTAAELIERARSIATDLGVDYLETRNLERRHADWPHTTLYATFEKPIAPTLEENLAGIPRKQRAMVRKGQSAGLVSTPDSSIDRFYEAYARSLHALGTPVFSRRYFHTLREVFGDDCRILTITSHNRVVSSVMSFYFRRRVIPYYGGGTAEARALKANDFMYWELMRRSCEEGLETFDFGRSRTGTGAYAFKKHWGCQPRPLHYEYFLVRRSGLPGLNPANPRYRLAIAAWKRMPFWMTKVLGPHLVRQTTG